MSDVAGAWVAIHPDLEVFAEELKAKLESVDESADVNVGANTTKANAELDALAARLKMAGAIDIKANTTDAKAQIDDINARLAVFGRESAAPSVRLGGADEANARLAALSAQLDSVGGKSETAHVRVADDTPGGSDGWLRQILGWIVALGPASVAVGADMVGSFAALPALFGAGGLTAAALGSSLDGLVQTLKDYQTANTDTNQSAAEAHTQLVTLQADMKNLSPAAQELVGTIEGQLLPAFHAFAAQDQQALFGAASVGIADLLPLFRDVSPYILDVATDLGEAATNAGKWATSSSGLSDINTILGESEQLLQSLGADAGKVFVALSNIGAQRSQFGPLASDVNDVANAFLRWSNDGGSEKFLAYVHQVAPEVRQDVDDLAHAVSTIVQDWAPLAPLWLGAAGDLAKIADALARVNPALAQMIPFLVAAQKLEATGFITKLAAGFGAGEGLAGTAALATGKISAMGSALKALPSVTDVAIAITVAETILGIANALSGVGKGQSTTDMSVQQQNQVLDGKEGAALNQAIKSGAFPRNGDLTTLDKQYPNGATDAEFAKWLAAYDGASAGGRPASNVPLGAVPPPNSKSLYDSTVPGSGTGTTPGSLTPAQSLAQSLTSSVNSMLATLGGLSAPAKNAVVAQQTALAGNGPQLQQLIQKIVAAHQSALTALIPQLVAAHAAAEAQLVQLQKAQNVNAAAARTTDAANAKSTATGDASTLAGARAALNGPGGGSAVDVASVAVAKIQQSTDAVVAKAQAGVTAAANGTELQQANAAKALADAKATQQVQLAAANSTLDAATILQNAADALASATNSQTTDAASSSGTSTTDAAAVAAATLAASSGGSTPVLLAQLAQATTQQTTDAAVAAARAVLDQANISGTKSDQDSATTALTEAEATQTEQLAAAAAAVTAAQSVQAAADALESAAATLATDSASAFSSMTGDISKAASDLSSGMAALVSDAATAFTNWSNATVAAIEDAAQRLHDVMTGEIQSVTDQSNITIDTLAEQGLSGFALQAAQAKVALDQMTASYNQQINALQVGNVDAARAANDQLVAAATSNLDAVTSTYQANVNSATQQANSMVSQAQNAVSIMQAIVDQAGDSATDDQKLALAQAQAALTEAQANGSAIVASATSAQQSAVTQAQALLAQANGNAAILNAQGTAALQAVTDQANLAETQQQALLNLLEAKANGSGGTTVSVEINNYADPLQGVDAMIFELRAAGVL